MDLRHLGAFFSSRAFFFVRFSYIALIIACRITQKKREFLLLLVQKGGNHAGYKFIRSLDHATYTPFHGLIFTYSVIYRLFSLTIFFEIFIGAVKFWVLFGKKNLGKMKKGKGV